MIYPGLIDAAMILFLSLSVSSCQPPEVEEESLLERRVIVQVCNNPGSIWHLSECNAECTKFEHDGGYCLTLTVPMCENIGGQTDFVRRACGFYYREE